MWFCLRVKDSSSVKELKVKDETSSDSEDKIMMKSSLAKRKGEMEAAEVVEKKKKGRPRKDAKMMPISQPFPQVTFLLSKDVWTPKSMDGPVQICSEGVYCVKNVKW